MKQVNKKVLKVVERVMRKEAVYGIDLSLIHILLHRVKSVCEKVCIKAK